MSLSKTKPEKIVFQRWQPVKYFDGEMCTFIRKCGRRMCIILTSKNLVRHTTIGNICIPYENKSADTPAKT